MKTFSIVKTPLFTLILAFMLVGTIGISAAVKKFKAVEDTKNVVVTDQHWNFIGSSDPGTPDNYLDPQQYEPASENENCDGSTTLCQVKAPADLTNDPTGNTPDFQANVAGPNQSVEDRIDQALNSSTPNETTSMQD